MNHGSLFSGIGGFDLSSEWMGWDNKFHCEWEEFPKKILKYYWPNAKSYGDIKKTDFTIWRGKIDILTGGFPCQPYSQAGKRLGKEDDRHLWPEMLRGIREIQPRWIVGENVYGITNWNGGVVFEEVQTDLENEGYSVQSFILPAASVNAPHRRDRVWFIAYSNGSEQRDNQRANTEKKGDLWGNEKGNVSRKLSSPKFVANANSRERKKRGNNNGEGRIKEQNEADSWSKFPTISPFCNGDDGISGRLDSITFQKWRKESIKGAGNAIVPQVAHQIFKAIEEYELLQNKRRD